MTIGNISQSAEGKRGMANEGIPVQLLGFKTWLEKTAGREATEDEDNELFALCTALSEEDDTFKGIFAEDIRIASETNDGADNRTQQKSAAIKALSAYLQEFGLKVD
jgi:hypothetical protein